MIKPDPATLTYRYAWARTAQAAVMGFAFPAPGDIIEVCMPGWYGASFKVTEVHDAHVVVFAPCNVPGCEAHDPYSSVPTTAIRPHLVG